MSTLTDRYVWAVVRLLPERQRAEIDRELHELIDETIDARRHDTAATDPAGLEQVERGVLIELGDPGRMAARYVERPRALVGHDVFPEYVRVLKLVAAIALPTVTALAVLGAALDTDKDAWGVAGTAVGALFNTAIQVAFWVTLVYAFADRWKADSPWTPDDLPDLPAAAAPAGFKVGDAAFGIVLTALAGVALVWQHHWPVLRDDGGDGVPFLDPDIWGGFGQALLVVLAASIGVQLVALVRRRWTYGSAAVNTLVNAASTAIVAWLAFDERLLNQQFLDVLAERTDIGADATISPWVPVLIVAGIDAWDTGAAWVSAYRDRRVAAAPH